MDREEYPAPMGDSVAVSDDESENAAVSAEPFEAAAEPVDLAPTDAPELRLLAPDAPPRDLPPEQIIEALLFSADTPLSAARLGELSGVGNVTRVRLAIAELNDKYRDARLAFRVEEIARGYQMLTLPQFQPWVAKLNRQQAQTRLSAAALEALAIVAYKQPVIRAEIEAIRGVASGEVLNRLRELGLVKIVGRAEIVGRPLMYGTTRKFLDVFGLADLADLPPMESLALRRPAAKEPAAAVVPEQAPSRAVAVSA